jgi:hypothetical protein
MKELQQEDILRLMREEWNKKVTTLAEKVDLTLTGKVAKGDGEKLLLSPELKVIHNSSGLKYTIDSVSPRDVILRTPEGDKFLVNAAELEKEYSLE